MFDFGIGASELIVLGIVALIVVGPKDLPKLLRSIGQVTTKVRAMAREFQSHLEEAARDTGLDEVKKEVNKMTNFTVTSPIEKEVASIKKAVEAPTPATAKDEAKPAALTNGEAEPAAAAKDEAKPAVVAKDEAKPAVARNGAKPAAIAKDKARPAAAKSKAKPAAADRPKTSADA